MAAPLPHQHPCAQRRNQGKEQPTPGLMVHSDLGGQYYTNACRALLHRHHCLRSQSRRGECYDNAQTESLWSRLKTEELEHRAWPFFANLADAQASVANDCDYYNYKPLHSNIHYQTPFHVHQQLFQPTTPNCSV